MNVGPTELVLVLIIVAIPLAAVVLIVFAARSSRRTCATCGQQVARQAATCPHCGAVVSP